MAVLRRLLTLGPQHTRHCTETFQGTCWRQGCYAPVKLDDLLGLCSACIEELRTW